MFIITANQRVKECCGDNISEYLLVVLIGSHINRLVEVS